MEIGQIDIGYIVLVLGVILFSMTLHEAMHGFVAYWLGDDTAKMEGRLTLNPIKHIDPFLTIILPVILALAGAPIFGGAKPVPFNPARVKGEEWGSALVALAGPLTNLMIAFVGFGVWALTIQSGASFLSHALEVLVSVNLGFFIFNVLPIPPLDGSRVVYAIAPDFVRRGMEGIEQFGVMFVFLIVFVASSAIGQFMAAATQAIITAFMFIFGMS